RKSSSVNHSLKKRPTINSDGNDLRERTTPLEWIGAALVSIVTALIVVWQNSHLAVLWDLSYVLETSYRISMGQIPYRDFPFVHAPLTFLTQAAIIKMAGRVFWHQVLYFAVAGGIATLLTWRILRNILR